MNVGTPCDKGLADYLRPKARVQGSAPFCRELLNTTFEYVDFNLPHGLSDKDLGRVLDRSLLEVGSHAGRADFNNDGKTEILLPVTARAWNSRTCDIPLFVEVNSTLTQFMRGPLDKLLAPSDSCPAVFAPFRHKSTTYFETRRRFSACPYYNSCFGFDLLTEVHLVDGLTRKTVCTFSYALQ
jgi:hypothetical protein